MEFRVLGLLEVWDGGEVIPVGGGKQRAVLAMLLLHANKPVSADVLISELWGDQALEGARKSLQQYVSRLRRSLGADRLATTPAGYVLRVDASAIDAVRFGRLVTDARAALASGDADSAERQFSSALALWRGQALADFRYDPFAQEAIRRLESERRAAAADRIDAQLDLGREELVLTELEELAGEDPYWERPRAQLMVALYRTGRQRDALDLYRETRALLSRELGLTPSRELQELERAILNQDPALGGGKRRRQPLRGTRPRRIGLVAAACVLAGGAAGSLLALTRGPSQAAGANDLAAFSAAGTGRPSYISVGTTPTAVSVGGGGVWVLNADDRTISRVDPSTRKVAMTFSTGSTPTDLAAGAGAVWVGTGAASGGLIERNSVTAAIARVDPRSAVVTKIARLPGLEAPRDSSIELAHTLGVSGIAVAETAVWAIDPDGSIARIDPATGSVVAQVPATQATAIASGDAGVWFLTTTRDGTPAVARVDATTNSVGQVIPLHTSALVGIAVGGGSVWATDPYGGVVWRIDPGLKPLTRTFELGFGVTQIAFGSGSVWVADIAGGALLRLDPKTDKLATFPLSGTPIGLAIGGGAAWVSIASGVQHRPIANVSCGPVESGGAKPDLLVVSDLPLQGPRIAPTFVSAIEFVLRSHRFRAGRFVVGYQSCDDSTAGSQTSEFFKCASNARDFASDKQLVAVLGPYDSDCAQIEIPLLNRSPLGPLALVSPSSTSTSLTRAEPGGTPGAPGIYYPTHIRSYFRLAPPDVLQGAAEAVLAKQLGLRRMYLLSDRGEYGDALNSGFRAAVRHVGVTVAGSGTWQPTAASYAAVVERIADAHAGGVLVGGYGVDAAGMIRALRARFGSRLTIIGGDGLLTVPELLRATGVAARGVFVSLPGVTTESLTPAGRKLVAAFDVKVGGSVPSGTYLPEMLEGTEVLIDAIGRSDGTRASVLAELRRIDVQDGLYGGFRFDSNGDSTPSPFAILRITGGSGTPGLAPDYRGAVVDRTIRAPLRLLQPVPQPSHRKANGRR